MFPKAYNKSTKTTVFCDLPPILRQGDGFAGPGGHSANLKAWMSILAGLMSPLHPSLAGFTKNEASETTVKLLTVAYINLRFPATVNFIVAISLNKVRAGYSRQKT